MEVGIADHVWTWEEGVGSIEKKGNPMRKPVGYIVETGNTLEELEKNVNGRIAQGFEPTGGVFAGLAASVGLTRWLQAVVKFEDSN